MQLNRVETLVYEILARQQKPLSAYDLLELVKNQGVKSPPLIYRALKKLATNHLAHRLEALNSYIVCREQSHLHQHHFFICQQCHQVFEDNSNKLKSAIEENALTHHFLVKRSIVEVLGLCLSCQDE